MRVVVVSTAVFRCPPPDYGGAELVAWLLARELAQMGVDVWLVAVRGSRAPPGAKLVETIEEQRDVHEDWLSREARHYEAYRRALEPVVDDETVIIDHTWFKHVYLWKRERPGLRVVGVLHGMVSWRRPPPVDYPCLVGVSRAHAEHIMERLGVYAEFVHNGLDLDLLGLTLYEGERDDYYLSLNRIMPEKGIVEFVDCCVETRSRGVVVGEDRFVASQQYVTAVKSKCWETRGLVEYVGKASHEEKVELLRHARATVLLPMKPYLEVFGIAAVESLAVGTPVVALRNGGLAEILEPLPDLLCDGLAEVRRLMLRLHKGSPYEPRELRRVAERFTSRRMAEGYLELARKVLDGWEW